MGRFEGKVGVVTGAGKGIGEAYARGLAAEGAAVVIAEIDVINGERVAKEVEQAGGTALFVQTDVASEESTLGLGEVVAERLGGCDLLVNNAAIYGGMRMDTFLTVSWDYYERFMSVNMNGALLVTRALWQQMAERGGGSIVNQSSSAAWMGGGFYGTAKLALHGITQSLARELGSRNIRVNAIAPGPTDTEATRETVPDVLLKKILQTMPLPRLGTVEDMVAATLFLLSDDASFITGHVLTVDGGQVMRP